MTLRDRFTEHRAWLNSAPSRASAIQAAGAYFFVAISSSTCKRRRSLPNDNHHLSCGRWLWDWDERTRSGLFADCEADGVDAILLPTYCWATDSGSYANGWPAFFFFIHEVWSMFIFTRTGLSKPPNWPTCNWRLCVLLVIRLHFCDSAPRIDRVPPTNGHSEHFKPGLGHRLSLVLLRGVFDMVNLWTILWLAKWT